MPDAEKEIRYPTSAEVYDHVQSALDLARGHYRRLAESAPAQGRARAEDQRGAFSRMRDEVLRRLATDWGLVADVGGYRERSDAARGPDRLRRGPVPAARRAEPSDRAAPS